jgi:hypothetical protein
MAALAGVAVVTLQRSRQGAIIDRPSKVLSDQAALDIKSLDREYSRQRLALQALSGAGRPEQPRPKVDPIAPWIPHARPSRRLATAAPASVGRSVASTRRCVPAERSWRFHGRGGVCFLRLLLARRLVVDRWVRPPPTVASRDHR